MEILRFTLSGKQAFFKKPEVNAVAYFTYGHVHKVALLGMFGAILGYGGYAQANDGKPEFYQKLQKLKVSVKPDCTKGCFERKMVTFNNSVGYASLEKGGNLIVKQQWLEHPKWEIYVQMDSEEAKKLAEYICNHRCVYIPYLGSNDHLADITDAKIIQGTVCEEAEHIDSLVEKEAIKLDLDDYETENPYKYEEALPVTLDEELQMYQLKRYVLTNMQILESNCEIYEVQDPIKQEMYHIVFH